MEGQSTTDWPEFPFCSPRCRLIDLGRWLGGEYRLPSPTAEDRPAEDDDHDEFP
jgi:endogenous inhibitor of DNA gyrase (YacG/DUF329 family)